MTNDLRDLGRRVLRQTLEVVGPPSSRWLGTVGAPLREMHQASRVVTVGVDEQQVREFWTGEANVAAVLPRPSELSASGEQRAGEPDAAGHWMLHRLDGTASTVAWLAVGSDGASADVRVRWRAATRDLGTEMFVSVEMGSPGHGSLTLPAAVLAVHAARGAKSLLETGERPTLRANPAARPAGAAGGGR